MHRNGLFMLTLAVLSLSMAGCSRLAPEGKGLTAARACNSQDIPLPDYNIEEGAAWTWLDITIGVTTEEELLAELGNPGSISPWPQSSREPQACVYRYQQLDNYPTFWLAGGRVIGARFSTYDDQTRMNGQPATFNEAMELYGRAEIVGWNPLGGHRSVVWLNYGILAEVIVGGKQKVSTMLYFSPMDEEVFGDSLWSHFVLETNPTVGTDHIDDYPRDPFTWE